MADLTKKQRDFAMAVADGARPTAAARAAGYYAAAVEASRLMQNPRVLQFLHRRRESRLKGDLASKAMRALEDLITNESTPAPTRYQASRWLLEQAGHKVQDGIADHSKPLEEMSPDELSRAVEQGMASLASIAQQLNGAHAVEGEWRAVQDVEPLEHIEEGGGEGAPDFLG